MNEENRNDHPEQNGVYETIENNTSEESIIQESVPKAEETNAKSETGSIYSSGSYEQQGDTLYRNIYYEDAYKSNVYRQQYTDQSASSENKKKSKFGKGAKFAAKAAVFGVIAGVAFWGVNAATNFIYPNSQQENQTFKLPVTVTPAADGQSNYNATTVMDVSGIISEVMPSVVSVVSRVSSEVIYGPFSLGRQEYDSSGSGIIIGQSDTELLIATNNHVVEGAQTVTVTFSDETPENLTDDISVDALVKGTRADNDLAVIAVPLDSIPEVVLSFIKIATLGDSDSLKVGEGTIAIGNALGYGQSVTTGCVSALNRQVTVEDLQLNMIQTDAAINNGNSGGALLNLKGEVIGINSAKASAEGMGYAIPISSVKDIINELMNRQTRSVVDASDKGYLGIHGMDVTAEYAKNLGAPEGISIQTISEGSPAEIAGLKKYDILTKFDGQTVKTFQELKELLNYYKAGEKVTVIVEYMENHQYVEREIEITLSNVPEQ